MMRCLRIILLIAIFGIFSSPIWADSSRVEYYSPNNILRFADFLYEDEDYLRAAGEYLRYLFYSSQGGDSIMYRISKCYRLGGETSSAIRSLREISEQYPQSPLLPSVNYEIAYSYFLTDKFDSSVFYANSSINHTSDNVNRIKLKCLIGFCYLKENRWNDAVLLYDSLISLTSDEESKKSLFKLKGYAEDGEHLSFKSSLAAGALSAVMPGLGKLYCKRYREALSSFIIVGVNGWQAYDGFHEKGKDSIRGWIFATTGCIFYLGNIYGSAIAANIYNQKQRNDLMVKIDVEIHFYDP